MLNIISEHIDVVFYTVVASSIAAIIFCLKDKNNAADSLVKNKLFWVLTLAPIALAITTAIPIWEKTFLCFNADCYSYFTDKYKLPIGLVAISATIATIYSLAHTSSQKELELKELKGIQEYQIRIGMLKDLDSEIASMDQLAVSIHHVDELISRLIIYAKKPMGMQSESAINCAATADKIMLAIFTEPHYMPAAGLNLKYLRVASTGVSAVTSYIQVLTTALEMYQTNTLSEAAKEKMPTNVDEIKKSITILINKNRIKRDEYAAKREDNAKYLNKLGKEIFE